MWMRRELRSRFRPTTTMLSTSNSADRAFFLEVGRFAGRFTQPASSQFTLTISNWPGMTWQFHSPPWSKYRTIGSYGRFAAREVCASNSALSGSGSFVYCFVEGRAPMRTPPTRCSGWARPRLDRSGSGSQAMAQLLWERCCFSVGWRSYCAIEQLWHLCNWRQTFSHSISPYFCLNCVTGYCLLSNLVTSIQKSKLPIVSYWVRPFYATTRGSCWASCSA